MENCLRKWVYGAWRCSAREIRWVRNIFFLPKDEDDDEAVLIVVLSLKWQLRSQTMKKLRRGGKWFELERKGPSFVAKENLCIKLGN